MINVSNEIKQAYDKSTTQLDKIVLNGEEYIIGNVEHYDDVYNEGNIFGTAIGKCLDFEIENIVDLEGQEFKYLTGIKVNGAMQWISLGNFITSDVEINDTTNIAKVSAMDYMLKSNIPYVTTLDYSSGTITLLQVLKEACDNSGIRLATTNFPNSAFIVDSNQFTEETLIRQVFQAVAQVSGTIAKIKENQLYLINPKETTTIAKVFTLNNYKEAEIKRATHPINVVSLGMADVDGENITLRDEESILKSGENVLAINDNPFAYTQEKREQLITALFNATKGFEYKSYTFKCQGLPYLETMDKIQFVDKAGNSYDSYIFRFNYKSPNGLESEIEAPSITDATVKYQNIPSALDIARRTEYIVNKQEGTIKALSSNVETIEKELVLNKTTEEGKQFYLTDSADSNCKTVEIFGESTQETRSGNNRLNLTSVSGSLNDKSPTLTNGVINVKGTNNLDYPGKESYRNGYIHLKSVDKWEDGATYYFSCKVEVVSNQKNIDTSYFSCFLWGQAGFKIFYNSATGRYEGKVSPGTGITELNKYVELRLDGCELNISEPMLTTEAIYEYNPYGKMPSHEFPSEIESISESVEIESIGKNKLILTRLGGGYNDVAPVLADNKIIVTGMNNTSYNEKGTYRNGYVNVFDINWKSNTKYYISMKINVITNQKSLSTDYFRVAAYGDYGLTLNYNADTDRYEGKFTTLNIDYLDASKNYLEIRIDGMELEIYDISISTIDYDYESDKYSITVIPLLHDMRSLSNGARDRIYYKDGKWYDEQKVGRVILDGTQTVHMIEPGLFRISLSGYKLQYALCSHFKCVVNDQIVDNTTANTCLNDGEMAFRDGTTKDRIFFKISSITTLEEFKTWLFENLVEVIYELAEPIITEITAPDMINALESIKTFKDVTNIETDAPSILTYYTNSTIVQEMITKAEFTITNEQINAEVRKKVGENEIISKINQTAEETQIDANRISLKRFDY